MTSKRPKHGSLAMPEPRISFLIGGVQKGGTTALASFLRASPHLRLPRDKEAHVFDAPDFDERWTRDDIDQRFQSGFAPEDWDQPSLRMGDATPITMFVPRVVRRVARYNPDMKWVILLRDPVSRAVSQWHMEHARGAETLPMALAFALERLRLAGRREDLAEHSPLRRHSYLARGDYAPQLRVLREHFPAKNLLLLRSEDLSRDPAGGVAAVLDHLGLPPLGGAVPTNPVFAGGYAPPRAWSPAIVVARFLSRSFASVDECIHRHQRDVGGGGLDGSR